MRWGIKLAAGNSTKATRDSKRADGRASDGLDHESLRKSLQLKDSQLIVGKSSLEVTGKLVNTSPRVLLEAKILTTLTLSTGRKLPRAIGIVRLLEPGRTAFFRTRTDAVVTGDDKMKLGWQSELGELLWGEPLAKRRPK